MPPAPTRRRWHLPPPAAALTGLQRSVAGILGDLPYEVRKLIWGNQPGVAACMILPSGAISGQ